MVYNKLIATKCSECLKLYEELNMSLKHEETRRENLVEVFLKDVFELSDTEKDNILGEFWSLLGFTEDYASRFFNRSKPYEERARREREEELAWERAQKSD